jgi:hypothetical protein
MADATKLPLLQTFYWGTTSEPNPKITSSLENSATAQTVTFNIAPTDSSGTILTGDFLIAVRNKAGFTEVMYVPAGGMSDDGLTASNVIRGIDTRAGSIDYTVSGGSAFIAEHQQGSTVYCPMSSTHMNLILRAVQGTIATGGTSLIIGDETDTNVTVKAALDGSTVGFLRKNATSGEAEFSNDGTIWISFNDSIASSLFTISAADTTPGYGEDKIVAGTNVTITKQNTGANETLSIAASSQREGVTTHATYTPGYMTGGSSAESNVAIWDSVSDGSFRVTVDGVAYNVDGIDFTAPVTSMAEVASTIQAALRAVTSGLETVVWSTDHFVITSADTTVSSEISVLTTSTGTVGTDISGVGTVYMDSETGRGVATAAVLDPTADVGKVPLLNANANVDTDLLQEVIPTGGYTAKGELIAGSAADTPALVSAGSNGQIIEYDSSQTAGIKPVTPLYVGVGSSAQSNVESYQLQWFDPAVVAVWTAAGAATATTYAFNWAYISTTSSRTLITANPPFQRFDTGSPSPDPLRWGHTTYTTAICEFEYQFAADTAIGANGFGFGFVSNVSSLTDYDHATNEGVNFSVDSSGALYAHTSDGATGTETAITGITLANRNTYRIEFDRRWSWRISYWCRLERWSILTKSTRGLSI